MENNKQDAYQTNDHAPIEADDFAVNDMEGSEVEGEGKFEPSLPSEETAKLKAELEEQKDKYIRLFAEFDNFKRRSAKERIEMIQTAGKEVITSMLQVVDDMDRAEKQIQTTKEVEQIKEGVQLVFNKFRKTLTSKGLKAMESIGTDFDVEKHEAITEIPVKEEKQKGKVVDEIEKGLLS